MLPLNENSELVLTSKLWNSFITILCNKQLYYKQNVISDGWRHSRPFNAEIKEYVKLYLRSLNTPSWHGVQWKRKPEQGQLYLYMKGK
jgi:hypothetical protein